jgi:short-subunit dehydrogenase
MSKLKNKVAVVTGASKGIGASIAKYFAAEGAKVVVNYASSKEGADSVVKEITDNGGIAIAVQADVSKEADVTRLFEETKKAFGTLDILVNNAVFQQFLPIEQASAEAFHQHFNVNVLGPVLTIQASLKLFGDKGGNIINISSGASKSPLAGVSLYSATKAALDAITISLSKELGQKTFVSILFCRALRKQKVQPVRASLLAVSMKKCLLPIHRLVVEASPKILRKLPYFLLPMMPRGLRVSKFPFRVVCMVFKLWFYQLCTKLNQQ